jgi:hypothetical protein
MTTRRRLGAYRPLPVAAQPPQPAAHRLLSAGALVLLLLPAAARAQQAAAGERPLLVQRPPEEILQTAGTASDQPPLPDRAAIHAAIASGLEHLLASQNADGSWGSWGEPADAFWSNPHSHFAWIAATTGLAVLALLEAPESEAATAAIARALDFLGQQAPLKRPSDWDVDNTWGLIYGLEALSVVLQHPRWADGERGYYDLDTLARRPSWSTSFMTATAILALHSAGRAGLPVPEERRARAVAALERCRLPSGAYTYSVEAIPSPGGAEYIDQLKGSLGRTQVGNLALFVAGSPAVAHDDLLSGLDAFFEHHRFLDIARKRPYPHEAYYYNSGYFYFFGHYYAARVLELLPVAEQVRYQARLAREVVKTQEADGAMWDFYMHTYHKASPEKTSGAFA